MQYSVAHWTYGFKEEWEQAVFEQRLADMGFDCFDGEDAYIQTALLDRQAIEQVAAETAGVELVGIDDCPDENWNATWEAEHPAMELPLGVTIVPHCAFGAGYHETTAMMIDSLLTHHFKPHSIVLDNGCGTGVLGIMALKRGAEQVIAVDIDEHSVTNAQENAERNGVTMDVRLGDTPPAGRYDLIVSNIHRNILLAQMDSYSRYLAPDGEVWLSGFYAADIPALEAAAKAVGLAIKKQQQNGEWIQLQLYQRPTA